MVINYYRRIVVHNDKSRLMLVKEGRLEIKLPTVWTHMDTSKTEMGRVTEKKKNTSKKKT